MVVSLIVGTVAAAAAAGGSAAAKVSAHVGLVGLGASVSVVGPAKASAAITASVPGWGLAHGAYAAPWAWKGAFGYAPWAWNGGYSSAPWAWHGASISCIPGTWPWTAAGPWTGTFGGLPYAPPPFYI